jgi:hypothetical protein
MNTRSRDLSVAATNEMQTSPQKNTFDSHHVQQVEPSYKTDPDNKLSRKNSYGGDGKALKSVPSSKHASNFKGCNCCELLVVELDAIKAEMKEIKEIIRGVVKAENHNHRSKVYEVHEDIECADITTPKRSEKLAKSSRNSRRQKSCLGLSKSNISANLDVECILSEPVSEKSIGRFENDQSALHLDDVRNSNDHPDLNSTASTLFMELNKKDEINDDSVCLESHFPDIGRNVVNINTDKSSIVLSSTIYTDEHPCSSENNNDLQNINAEHQTEMEEQNSNSDSCFQLNAPAYAVEQCLIVKSLPESDDNIPKNRLKRDLAQIQMCFSYLLREGERLDICKAFRLGKYEPSGNPRPLKIIFRDEMQRNILLQRKFLLRGYSPCVFFQREYTPKERHKYRELYLTMKTRMDLGESSLMIKNGEIIKRERSSYLWINPVSVSYLMNSTHAA